MPATRPCEDWENDDPPYWNCIPLDPTISPQPTISNSPTYNPTVSHRPTVSSRSFPQHSPDTAPTIDGFTFVGKGCCENAKGDTYAYETIYENVDDVEACAVACKKKYSSSESFVGINFLLRGSGYTNCNCMMDESNNGAITGAGGWCNDELCYSYNGDSPSTSTTVEESYASSN